MGSVSSKRNSCRRAAYLAVEGSRDKVADGLVDVPVVADHVVRTPNFFEVDILIVFPESLLQFVEQLGGRIDVEC